MKNQKKLVEPEVLKFKMRPLSRIEKIGQYQIFNGFHQAVEVTIRKIGKKKALATLLAFLVLAPNVWAQVPEASAVRAIVGEAAGEGRKSMLFHAHAIRNRGTLRGVYGFSAAHSDSESRRTWEDARWAWRSSGADFDPTRGASYWFSDEDLARLKKTRPSWFLKLRPTARIGSTTFYRGAR